MVSLVLKILKETSMQSNPTKVTIKAGNANLFTRSRLLMNSLRFLPMGALIGLIAGGMPGLLFAVPGSFALAVMLELLSGIIGCVSSSLCFVPGRGNCIAREQSAGSLNQVRYHKMCRDYPMALSSVENVLARDPGFPEAWLSKAQILWEGLGDASGARQCLAEIWKIEPNRKSPFHRWALILNKEITESSKTAEYR
jgi:hypothetical protein